MSDAARTDNVFGSASSFSDDAVIARCLLRRVYRAVGALPASERKVLLVGGYSPKLSALKSLFAPYGHEVIALMPRAASGSVDNVIDLLDGQHFCLEIAIALVDCAIAVCDELNQRFGAPTNDPRTSALRRDKFDQQEALRRAGLAAAAQCVGKTAQELVDFWSRRQPRRIVVKPRDSSGGDGIWLCDTEEQILAACAADLGNANVEGSVNHELIGMEAVIGEEWVVNSVTLDGVHKVTDIWRGPPKTLVSPEGGGPAQFLYTAQFLAEDSPRREEVWNYCRQVLDVLGVRHGAAHTELVLLEDGPRLLEVNARPAGGLPRVAGYPNQLAALTLSLYAPQKFLQLPETPTVSENGDAGSTFLAWESCFSVPRSSPGCAVVFLRAPHDGWLSVTALDEIMNLNTFCRFERDLLGLRQQNVHPVRVKKTTGLFSSPGAVVLQGHPAEVEADAAAIRVIEEFGYTEFVV